MNNHMPPRLGMILADHSRGPEYALVECIDCEATCRIEDSKHLATDELREQFETRGWSIGPTRCPKHAGFVSALLATVEPITQTEGTSNDQ